MVTPFQVSTFALINYRRVKGLSVSANSLDNSNQLMITIFNLIDVLLIMVNKHGNVFTNRAAHRPYYGDGCQFYTHKMHLVKTAILFFMTTNFQRDGTGQKRV